MVTAKSLEPVLDLSAYPNSVVDVFIELPETEAGSRCAGINAAAMALADAGLKVKDIVAAVSVGRVDDKLVVDLDYTEESYPEGHVADIPIAMVPATGKLTLLQMDGIIPKEDLVKVVELGKTACVEISKIQKDAIRKKYAGSEKNE